MKQVNPQKEDELESVFAVPCSQAFVTDESSKHLLYQKNTAVLDALRRVRQIEEKVGNFEKVKELDRQIERKRQRDKAKITANIEEAVL